MTSQLLKTLAGAYQRSGSQLIYLASDVKRGLDVAIPQPFSREQYLANHYAGISRIFPDADFWVPAFNYDFSKSRVFNLSRDRSQVGHLSEYFRTRVAKFRTMVPIYSFAGTGSLLELHVGESVLNPFGANSIFARMVERDALIFAYGCNWFHHTIIHYCEELAGALLYRYFKTFSGHLQISEQVSHSVAVRFHVRPLGFVIDYDWPRLRDDLTATHVLTSFVHGQQQFHFLSSKALVRYWCERLQDDPLYLLTPKTKKAVTDRLETIGGPFTLEEFES